MSETASRLPDLECPVCYSRRWSSFRTPTRLRGCETCGVVINDRSTDRQDEERRYEQYSQRPGSQWIELEATRVAQRQWAWASREFLGLPGVAAGFGDSPGVLDVGCGHGAFLRCAREAGCRVGGVELDPQGAAACRQAGLDVREGSLFDVGLPPGPWHLVTLWDVLEHLEAPGEALRRVVAVLAPNGTLVIRGRNARVHASCKVAYERFRPLAGRLRVPDLSCVHRWGFGPDHYRVLLLQAGLEGVELYPGIPTPGDRSHTLGSAGARIVKGAVTGVGMALSVLSLGRLYPFPSVLASARSNR